MELKDKVELKDKGQEVNLPDISQAVIALNWTDPVDLDLMAMIEKKDGSTHGVFTSNLDGDMGNLNAFPFLTLSEDAGVGATGGENEEVIKMTKVDPDIAKIRLVALNYTDAKAKNEDVSFANYNGKIQIKNQSGESFEVPLKSEDKGTVALIATIDNTGIVGPKLINESSVMNLRDAIEKIPGMKALVS